MPVNPQNSPAPAGRWKTFGLSRERDYFIENFIILLDSGMGILEVLEAIKEGTNSRRMQRIIDGIKEGIKAGSSFNETLKNTSLFSEKFISMAAIGESAGRLSENLKILSFQQEKEKLFAAKIRSAMMYPALVLSLVVMIGTGLVWFLLPRLAVVFDQLNIKLPPLTRALMALGRFFSADGLIFFPTLLIVVVGAIIFLFILPKTKASGQYLAFHLPIIKKIIQERELSRFGYVLGTLLTAGIPIDKAVQSLEKATSFYNYRSFYRHLNKSITEGNSFQGSFKSYALINKLMPVPIQQMILAGERSGKLAVVLLKSGAIFENKLDVTTKNLTVLLEPILLIIVWAGVLTLALAIVIPIYSLVGNLN